MNEKDKVKSRRGFFKKLGLGSAAGVVVADKDFIPAEIPVVKHELPNYSPIIYGNFSGVVYGSGFTIFGSNG